MTTTIALCQFNNYYNRQIKGYDYTIEDFEPYILKTIQNVNFNPADGVDTELIINYDVDASVRYKNPDYLLVIDDDGPEVIQQWYILDSTRTRSGQYKLKLRRAVIEDYYHQIKSAPVYVTKGYVDKNNPLIYNREGLQVNQIKTSEHLIKDSTQSGWIVGYVDPKYPEAPVDITGETLQEVIPDISTFEYKNLVGSKINGPLNKAKSRYEFAIIDAQGYTFQFSYYQSIAQYYLSNILSFGAIKYPGDTRILALNTRVPHSTVSSANVAKGIERVKEFDMYINPSIFETKEHYSDIEIDEILQENGKVYKDGSTYRRVKVVRVGEITDNIEVSYATNPSIYNAVKDKLVSLARMYSNYKVEETWGNQAVTFPLRLVYNEYRIEMEEITSPNTIIKYKIDKTSSKAKDAPYKMFCIPYDGKIQINTERMNVDKQLATGIAMSLVETLQPASGTGGGHLYDIQLLPYCPFEKWFHRDSTGYNVLGESYTEGINYSLVKDGASKTIAAIFYAPYASFTKNIPYSMTLPADSIKFKVARETEQWRLNAPNYANFEDIDPYLNNGIEFFNVDCTYKPYTPYIKVNINFKNLYGSDFNDSRGLICGGDYSLPIMSEAWKTYEIQNKNYANIFERETQHLEVSHKVQMAQSVAGALAGAGGTAALGGHLAGPGGAIGGGIASALGGALDVATNQYLYNESMDLRKDLYNYSLQNIQAKPIGLVRTSAFNYNSKIFPFLEIYKSTEVEKTALENKIKYNGMTINAIGTILEYTNKFDPVFFCGHVIRLDDLNDDNHMARAICEELEKGVYI